MMNPHQTALSVWALLMMLLIISLASLAQAQSFSPNLQVQLIPQPLAEAPTHVQQRFTGYQVMLSNMGKTPLVIESVDLENGYGMLAVQEATRREEISLKSALLPWKAFTGWRNQRRNAKTAKATAGYTNTFAKNTIPGGQYITTQTLVPAGQVPKIVVRYRNARTAAVQELRQ